MSFSECSEKLPLASVILHGLKWARGLCGGTGYFALGDTIHQSFLVGSHSLFDKSMYPLLVLSIFSTASFDSINCLMLHKTRNVCISNRASGNCRSTPYSVYSPETYEGHWKQLTVRTSRSGHIMAIAYFNPQVFHLICNGQPRLSFRTTNI